MKKSIKKSMIFSFVCAMGLCSVVALSANNPISASAASATDFYMETGASIRLEASNPGIRWTANLDETYYNSIKEDVSEVYTMVNKVGAAEDKAVKVAHANAPVFEEGKAKFCAVIPYEIGEAAGQLTQAEFDKAVHIELTATTYIKLNDNTLVTATAANGTGVERTMIGVANYHQLTTALSAEDEALLRTYVGEAVEVTGDNKFTGSEYVGEALSATGDVYINAYKVGTANAGEITFESGFDSSFVSGESYKLSIISADKSVVYTDAVYENIVKDSTERFSWGQDPAISVVKGSKQYINTGIINGTPQNPVTLNGYEVITAGKYVNIDGKYELTDGTQMMEYAANVINENGDPDGDSGATTTMIAEVFKVRMTDIKDPTKVLDIEYHTPDWVTTAFYFGFTYTDGTNTYHKGIHNDTVVYGIGFGNSSHALSDLPKLVYHGNYQFGYGKGARTLTDEATGANLATLLADADFGAEGVTLSVNTGAKGMMITQLPTPVTPKVDEFTYGDGVSIVKANGGYEITTTASGLKVDYNKIVSLNNPDANVFEISTSTPSSLGKVIVRFADVNDPTKGTSFAIYNTASSNYGWGAAGNAYFRSGNLNDEYADVADGKYFYEGAATAVGNPAGRFGEATESIKIRFNATAEKKFSVYLDDPAWLAFNHAGDANLFSESNTECKVKVSIEFITNGQPMTAFVGDLGGEAETTTPDPEPELFTCTEGATVSEKTNGYEMTANTSGAKVTYNQTIDLNDPNKDIFKLSTSTPTALSKVVVRFTDVKDSTKGVALALKVETIADWGYATYVCSGNVDNECTNDFAYNGTAVSNELVRLGTAGNVFALRFDGSAEKKFSVYLPDPQYYGLKHVGDANLFSAENTSCTVNVSIEIYTNGSPATILVSNIGGDFFTAA